MARDRDRVRRRNLDALVATSSRPAAPPTVLVSCNCSICRRYGTLWTYFRADRVRVEHAPKGTQAYAWGGRRLRFVRCARCGCVTHWEVVRPRPASRIGVNARLLEPEVLESIRVRRLDGARTWKYLD